MSRDYFDALEAELMAAVPRVSADQPRERERHPVTGILVPSLAVLATIAVVVIAGSLRGHARHGGRPASGNSPAAGGVVGPAVAEAGSVAQLRAAFGLFTRAQTAADRSWRPPVIASEPAVAGSERLAGTLTDGDRVFVVIRRDATAAPAARFLVSAYTVARGGGWRVAAARAPMSSLAPGGVIVAYRPFPVTHPGLAATIWVSLVPRTIETVRWGFACPPAISRRACGPAGDVIFTVPVGHGLATAWVRHAGSCPGSGCLQPVSVTWFGPHGIASGYQTAKAVGTAVRSILRGDGVGAARFGAPTGDAIADVDAAVGASGRVTMTGGCRARDAAVFKPPALAAPLTLYFRSGRFVAYTYGSASAGSPAGDRSAHLALSTDRGLALGDAVASARRLYRAAFVTSASTGGTWRAGTAHGALTGMVELDPRTGAVVHSADRIATIGAGSPGCGAGAP